jgi:tRNA threonylcarbamoyladenosine biosynthesis protein TsaB
MIILTLRTDKPEAEIGVYDNEKQLAYETWEAHRQLAETVHKRIEEILNKLSISLDDIQGIVCFKGPGSFTGLRIGLTVANALAYARNIPVVARTDPQWLEKGIKDILAGQNEKIAIPEYGAEAKTTQQRK